MKRDINNITEQERLALPVSKRDHIQGPANAALTLVEYGDYECPFCGQAAVVVKAVERSLGPQLRFVFRHFPLVNAHPHAEHAAEAAEAAAAQGRFWEMHDFLYENQNALEDEDLVQYADALGLDSQRLAAELEGEAHVKRVREDFLSGVRSGVNGTPTFFINERRYDGAWDLESFLSAFAGPSP